MDLSKKLRHLNNILLSSNRLFIVRKMNRFYFTLWLRGLHDEIEHTGCVEQGEKVELCRELNNLQYPESILAYQVGPHDESIGRVDARAARYLSVIMDEYPHFIICAIATGEAIKAYPSRQEMQITIETGHDNVSVRARSLFRALQSVVYGF